MTYSLEKLLTPFPTDEIEWRVGSTNKEKTKGLALAYVTNRAIQKRLDLVFGALNWQNLFSTWKDKSQLCGISVWDEDKKQWITKWDGSDDSATEAIKGGLSDSMKRAAYQWGIGRYLYEMPQIWVKFDEYKHLSEIPKIPNHLLPIGFKYPENYNSSTDEKESKKETLFEKLTKFLTENKITSTTPYFNFYNIVPEEKESIPPQELWLENVNSYKIHSLEIVIIEKIKNNDLLKSDYSALEKTLKNVTEFYNSVKGLK